MRVSLNGPACGKNSVLSREPIVVCLTNRHEGQLDQLPMLRGCQGSCNSGSLTAWLPETLPGNNAVLLPHQLTTRRRNVVA